MQRIFVPTALSPAALAGPEAGGQLHELHGETMGTTWSVKLVASPALALTPLQTGIQCELDRVVAQMSTWDTRSDLCRYNRAPAGYWQDLPEEFFEVLGTALALAEDTRGAYDPTAGPLVDCWGFGPAPPRVNAPEQSEIDTALAHVGWQRVALDLQRRRARQAGGTALDLSSIAKGYGVDQVARWLGGVGLLHFLVEVGGELRGQGVKPDGQPWWVALEQPTAAPDGETRASGTLVALDGISIATSGDYRRYFEADGARYAHTIDPRSGRPVADAPASVTVLHASCMRADALSTALTVLGAEAGMDYARGRGLAVLFLLRVDGGFEERMSPACAAMLA